MEHKNKRQLVRTNQQPFIHPNAIEFQRSDPRQQPKGLSRPYFELVGDNSTLGMLSPKDERIQSMGSSAELIKQGKSFDSHGAYYVRKSFDPAKAQLMTAGSNLSQLAQKKAEELRGTSPASTVFQKYAKSKEASISSYNRHAQAQRELHAKTRQHSQRKIKSDRSNKDLLSKQNSEEYGEFLAGRGEYPGDYPMNTNNTLNSQKSLEQNETGKHQTRASRSQNKEFPKPSGSAEGRRPNGSNIKSAEEHQGVGIGVGVDFGDHVDGASEITATHSSSIELAAHNNSFDMRLMPIDHHHQLNASRQMRPSASNQASADPALDSIHYSSQGIEEPRFVAQILPDKRLIDQTALEKKIATLEGKEGKLYILLTLGNMVTLYNHIIRKIIQEKKEATKGRYTSHGVVEKTRRVSLNPALFRNENTAPACFKGRLEVKARYSLHEMEESSKEYYNFLLNLRKSGQSTLNRTDAMPLFSVKRLQTHPKQEVTRIGNYISQVQHARKREQTKIEQQFHDSQQIYNQFLEHQRQPTQSSKSGSRANKRYQDVNTSLQASQLYQSSGLDDNYVSISPTAGKTHQSAVNISAVQINPFYSETLTGKQGQNMAEPGIRSSSFELTESQAASAEQILIQSKQARDSDAGIEKWQPKLKVKHVTIEAPNISKANAKKKSKKSLRRGESAGSSFEQMSTIYAEPTQSQVAYLVAPQMQASIVHSKGSNDGDSVKSETSQRSQKLELVILDKTRSLHPNVHEIQDGIEKNQVKNEPRESGEGAITYEKSPMKQKSQDKLQPHVIQLDQQSLVAFISPGTAAGYIQNEDYHSRDMNSRDQQRRTGRNTDENITMSTNMLEELEKRANDPVAKMDVNLKRSYHNMRRFVKSANPVGPFRSQTVANKVGEEAPSLEQVKAHTMSINQVQNQTQVNFGLLKTGHMAPQAEQVRATQGTRGSQSTYYGDKPLWIVPKTRKSTQPKQKGERKSTSQIGFYKKTRSSMEDSGQFPLAIDARNSINLQGTIDRYYNGELTSQDQLCNGDLLLASKALRLANAGVDQGAQTDEKLSSIQTISDGQNYGASPIVSTIEGIQTCKPHHRKYDSSATEKDRHAAMGTVPADQANMESVFDPVTHERRNPVRGSKLRMSETMGFRKLSPEQRKEKNMILQQQKHHSSKDAPGFSFRPYNNTQHQTPDGRAGASQRSELHVHPLGRASNKADPRRGNEGLGSTEYLVHKHRQASTSPNTQHTSDMIATLKRQQKLEVHPSSQSSPDPPLPFQMTKCETLALQATSLINSDINQVIRSTSLEKLYEAVEDRAQGHPEAKEMFQRDTDSRKPQSALPRNVQTNKRVIPLKKLVNSSSQNTGQQYEASLSKSNESSLPAFDLGVQGTRPGGLHHNALGTDQRRATKSGMGHNAVGKARAAAPQRAEGPQEAAPTPVIVVTQKQTTLETEQNEHYGAPGAANPLTEADIETELERSRQEAVSAAGENDTRLASAPKSRMGQQTVSQQKLLDSGPLSPAKHAGSVATHAGGGNGRNLGGWIRPEDGQMAGFGYANLANADYESLPNAVQRDQKGPAKTAKEFPFAANTMNRQSLAQAQMQDAANQREEPMAALETPARNPSQQSVVMSRLSPAKRAEAEQDLGNQRQEEVLRLTKAAEPLDLEEDEAGENKIFVQGGVDFLEVPKYLQEPPEQSEGLESASQTGNLVHVIDSIAGLEERSRSLSAERLPGADGKGKPSLHQSQAHARTTDKRSKNASAGLGGYESGKASIRSRRERSSAAERGPSAKSNLSRSPPASPRPHRPAAGLQRLVDMPQASHMGRNGGLEKSSSQPRTRRANMHEKLPFPKSQTGAASRHGPTHNRHESAPVRAPNDCPDKTVTLEASPEQSMHVSVDGGQPARAKTRERPPSDASGSKVVCTSRIAEHSIGSRSNRVQAPIQDDKQASERPDGNVKNVANIDTEDVGDHGEPSHPVSPGKVKVTASPAKFNPSGYQSTQSNLGSFSIQTIEQTQEVWQKEFTRSAKSAAARRRPLRPAQVAITTDLLGYDQYLQSGRHDDRQATDPGQAPLADARSPYDDQFVGPPRTQQGVMGPLNVDLSDSLYQEDQHNRKSAGHIPIRALNSMARGLQKDLSDQQSKMLRRNIMVHLRQQQLIEKGKKLKEQSRLNNTQSQWRPMGAPSSQSRVERAQKKNQLKMKQIFSVQKNQQRASTSAAQTRVQARNHRLGTSTSGAAASEAQRASHSHWNLPDGNIMHSRESPNREDSPELNLQLISNHMSPRQLRESVTASFNVSNAFSTSNDVQGVIKISKVSSTAVDKDLWRAELQGRTTSSMLYSHDYDQSLSTAMAGQPTAGVGLEVARNRERMKQVLKAGRQKLIAGRATVQDTKASRRNSTNRHQVPATRGRSELGLHKERQGARAGAQVARKRSQGLRLSCQGSQFLPRAQSGHSFTSSQEKAIDALADVVPHSPGGTYDMQ